jgi:hypothetical protein
MSQHVRYKHSRALKLSPQPDRVHNYAPCASFSRLFAEFQLPKTTTIPPSIIPKTGQFIYKPASSTTSGIVD